jgi:hypothetical protein
MTGLLEEGRQDVPKSTVVVDEENALCWSRLRHRQNTRSGNRAPAYMVVV